MDRLAQLIERELVVSSRSGPFAPALEYRYQNDLSMARRRHLTLCVILGAISYDGFLIWSLLLQDSLIWTLTHMLGIHVPCVMLSLVLLRRVRAWQEVAALLPSYCGLVLVYNLVINGPQVEAINQALFIFCWPLMLIYVNTCMKSPFKVALAYNLFVLTMIAVAIVQASVSLIVGGLLLTMAWSTAFFTLLGNYWANSEARRSYLYVLREEVRAASLSHANQDLQRLSETDPLTGLANRRQVQPHLDRLWTRHRQGLAEGAVLLIDIDHFKRYNDHYGHLLGDDCLRQVAATLKGALRSQDIIARFGGEEFVVLLVDLSPDAARHIAERLIEDVRALAIAHRGRSDGHDRLTISVGLAHTTQSHVASSDALLDRADRALYRAKRHGRDRLEQADHSVLLAGTPQPTVADLHIALAEDQFSLCFQPLYRLVPQRLSGYECLLRWQHPQLGEIAPDLFIALAERGGMIGDLGDWVLEQACLHAREWPAELSLSVNLSPLQLSDSDLPARLAHVLTRTGLAGERLLLELTEGAPLTIDAKVQANVAQLARLGVRLALDDFGCGHANLAYLLQLPFQVLKIDRQALRIEDPRQRRQVLGALLALGRTFSLDVLAEGVETMDDLTLLRELGFDQAQGYLLGRPHPIAQPVAWAVG